MSEVLPPIPELDEEDLYRTVGPHDMYDIARKEVARRVFSMDLAPLLEKGPYYDEDTGQTTQEKVIHELVMFQTLISEEGTTRAKMKRGLFHAQVGYMLDQFEAKLRQEQPGLDYKMVAVVIDRHGNTVSEPREYSGFTRGPGEALRAVEGQDERNTHPVQFGRTKEYAEVRDWRLRIRAVYADIAKGAMRDPNADIEPGWIGPMERYVHTRAIRHMSNGMRQRRLAAEALLREGHPSRWDPRFQSRTAPDTGAPVPPVPNVQTSGPNADEYTATIVALRKGGGGKAPKGPQAIAKELGLALDDVRRILRREGVDESRN